MDSLVENDKKTSRQSTGFRSFRTRVIISVLSLLLLLLAVIFFAVSESTSRNTQQIIRESLTAGNLIFRRLLDERTKILIDSTTLLTADFAFRAAYATGDYATRLDTARNYLDRAGDADVMIIVSVAGIVEVDTLHPGKRGDAIPWPQLLEEADAADSYTASAIVVFDEGAFQFVVVPLLVPDLKAWILVGRRLDKSFLDALKKLVIAEVSVVDTSISGKSRVLASTLPDEWSETVLQSIGVGSDGIQDVRMSNDSLVTFMDTLSSASSGNIKVVLQRSLNDAMQPYRRLQKNLVVLFVVAVIIALALAVALGRAVSRPIDMLAGQVRRIADGDFGATILLRRRDEFGQLADSVNDMAKGLAEKEKVRDLLGKVVSREVAAELLSRDITLGGEEREVTVLFSDIRNFTALCEDHQPGEVVAVLNRYLSAMSAAIENEGGVVDKYVGDAVMALFGAPIARDDDPQRAVRAAIGMQRSLAALNSQFSAEGLPILQSGIGVHTGRVIAGNLGSTSRLNYTVIGDAVNLAARLESLTKTLDAEILVSGETRSRAEGFAYRLLDEVQVRGRVATVTVFAVNAGTPDVRAEFTPN